MNEAKYMVTRKELVDCVRRGLAEEFVNNTVITTLLRSIEYYIDDTLECTPGLSNVPQARFIKLHRFYDKKEIAINVNNIVCIYPNALNASSTHVQCISDVEITHNIVESVDEVLKLIEEVSIPRVAEVKVHA